MNSLVYPMPDPRERVAPVDAGHRARRTSRTTSRTSSSSSYGAEGARSAAACSVTTTLDLGLQKIAREAIAKVLPPTDRARPPRSSRSTRSIRARCSRWSAARTTTRTSSTSRRRASASRARRSSRSCSRPRCRENIAPSSDPHLVEAGDDQRRRPAVGRSTTTRARRSARSTSRKAIAVLRQLGLLAADGDRRARETSRQTAHELGITTPLAGVLRDRARRRAGDAARDGARVRDRSPTAASASTARSSATQPRAVETIDVGGNRRRQPSRSRTTSSAPTQAATRQPAAAGRRPVRDRDGGRAPRPAGRRQDRDDRELRRRVVRRLHAAARRRRLGRLPGQARADADRVPRPRGRRRHLPGADLEGVHGEGAPVPEAARRSVFAAPPSLYASPVTVVNRGGVLERDNGVCKNTYSSSSTAASRCGRRQRGTRRDLQAERGRDPRRRRPLARLRREDAPGRASR